MVPYQYEKTSVCRDPGRMEGQEILDAKFSPNVTIWKKLMNTWGLYLIEGSTDGYWGASNRLYSKGLMEGRWCGQNKFGRTAHRPEEALLLISGK